MKYQKVKTIKKKHLKSHQKKNQKKKKKPRNNPNKHHKTEDKENCRWFKETETYPMLLD